MVSDGFLTGDPMGLMCKAPPSHTFPPKPGCALLGCLLGWSAGCPWACSCKDAMFGLLDGGTLVLGMGKFYHGQTVILKVYLSMHSHHVVPTSAPLVHACPSVSSPWLKCQDGQHKGSFGGQNLVGKGRDNIEQTAPDPVYPTQASARPSHLCMKSYTPPKWAP